MATLESSLSIFASSHRFSNNNRLSAKLPHSLKLHASTSLFALPKNFVFSSKASSSTKRLCFISCSALQEAETETETETQTTTTTEEKSEQPQQTRNVKKKLYVSNIPWSVSVADIKDLFGQCGTVTDVEIIKNQNGTSRGFGFVTMASGEEAQAVVEKFHSYQISGRIIKVELAKKFKKPSPSPPAPGPPPGETRHVIYASNLAWKVRSTHLREFFAENFKTPVSARVVFDTPSGKSTGYGFVSFLTKEDAEAAISALDGKELMERPLRLKFSEKKVKEAASEKDEAGSEKNEDQGSDTQLEENHRS